MPPPPYDAFNTHLLRIHRVELFALERPERIDDGRVGVVLRHLDARTHTSMGREPRRTAALGFALGAFPFTRAESRLPRAHAGMALADELSNASRTHVAHEQDSSSTKMPQKAAARSGGNARAKMSSSAHSYVRGARLFYDWLDRQPAGAVPEGPEVWICGDCHVGNLGPVADASGLVAVQIRDLDQSVVGNPAHDLLRLALSLGTAARSADLPGGILSRIAGALIAGYLQAFADSQSDLTKDIQRAAVVKTAIVLDAAVWVKGCSSLGRQRYAVLLDMEETCSNGAPHRIVDFKEAVDPPVA